MRHLAHTRSPLRIKAADLQADGSFCGYGSVFNVVDAGGDMIMPGAFIESLKRHAAAGTRPKGLWQHEHDHPILSWKEIGEDDHGLWCSGQLILEVGKAKEAHALMKAGELDGLSIGYECNEWEFCRSDELATKYGGMAVGYGTPAGQVRVMKCIDLWEVSLVTFPMNEAARVESVKRAPAALDLSPIVAALDRRQRLFA